MKYTVHTRNTCRICGSTDLRRFLDFADLPFTDDFVTVKTAGTEFLAPLSVYWCADCKTAQTQHNVEVTDYYREYRYTVSSSPFAQRFMRQLARQTFQRFGFQPGDSVVEVGSGDGYQLACFQQVGARVLGFEPSADLTKVSREAGVPVSQCLFNADTVNEIPAGMRPVQVVLLTYTFDHLPDPLAFLQAVRKVLDPERGVLLIEVHDLQKIMERRETCLFEHEHSIYLNVLTMGRLLARAGFQLLTTDLVPEAERRGNSLLVAAGLQGSRHGADALPVSTGRAALEEWPAYQAFGDAVRKSYARMRDYIRSRTGTGKRIAGYGAGGRGVMTLAMAGLHNDDIAYVCDQNTSFHGLYTPRSHVPVVAPSHLLEDPVDEVIVFSFGYLNEIREQLVEYTGRGGKLVSLLELL